MAKLTEVHKEILRRMEMGQWYRIPDDLGYIGHRAPREETAMILEDMGYVEIALVPRRGEDGEPVPNWRETYRYYHVFHKIKELDEKDIEADDLSLLEQLCQKWGSETISYLAHIRAWDGRRRLAEQKAHHQLIRDLLDRLEREKKEREQKQQN